VAPGLMADRARRYERVVRRGFGTPALARRLADPGSSTLVVAGPLKGLRLLNDAIADIDEMPAKILGTYELELADVIGQAVERSTHLFVDIGCADGYYAVGLAVAQPTMLVEAYDIAPSARTLCRRTAVLNGCERRVAVRGRFSAAHLKTLDMEGALLLCDIEGAERHLFDATLVRLLARTDVLIEVHESMAPGTRDHLAALFSATHTVARIPRRGRLPPQHPALAGWDDDERLRTVIELRTGDVDWLYLAPVA
jgi:hypothetical protein